MRATRAGLRSLGMKDIREDGFLCYILRSQLYYLTAPSDCITYLVFTIRYRDRYSIVSYRIEIVTILEDSIPVH